MTNIIHSVEVDIEYPFFQGHFFNPMDISENILKKNIKHKGRESLI